MLRFTKIALVFTVVLWGFLGAMHNLMDWTGTQGAVTAATSMTTFEGGSEAWQATSNPVVVLLGALFIMLSKFASALLCSAGGWKMWQARNRSAADFNKAKELALAGCAVAVIMLFGGFIVIAESWFELWRSDVMRGPVLGSAFRYAGLIMLIGLFIHSRDE